MGDTARYAGQDFGSSVQKNYQAQEYCGQMCASFFWMGQTWLLGWSWSFTSGGSWFMVHFGCQSSVPRVRFQLCLELPPRVELEGSTL